MSIERRPEPIRKRIPRALAYMSVVLEHVVNRGQVCREGRDDVQASWRCRRERGDGAGAEEKGGRGEGGSGDGAVLTACLCWGGRGEGGGGGGVGCVAWEGAGDEASRTTKERTRRGDGRARDRARRGCGARRHRGPRRH